MRLQYLLLGKVMYQDMLSAMQSVMDQDHMQDLFGEDMIILLTSSTVAGVKEASREFTCGESTCTGFKV